VLFLVLSFFSEACIWMLMQAEFLAIVLVLVYVGAVMVLFLFVVMMLDVNVNPVKEGFARYLPVGLLVALGMAAQMFMVIWTRGMEDQVLPMAKPQGYSHTTAVGEVLYSTYLYAFEIAAVILLVAIIAAIALTHRRRPETKYQDPSQQVRVKRSERVRLVKMNSKGEEV
jgi:NADH-quinone oxidoreductase subunit J